MVKYRAGRINEEVKKAVSGIIRSDIKDPRLTAMISVTDVQVTKDLGYAKVFVSIFGTDEEKKAALLVLKSSAGFIRRELGKLVKLRVTPQIIIELDDSIEKGMNIEALLHEIKEKSKNDN